MDNLLRVWRENIETIVKKIQQNVFFVHFPVVWHRWHTAVPSKTAALQKSWQIFFCEVSK